MAPNDRATMARTGPAAADAPRLIGADGRGSAPLLARLLAIADDAVLVVDSTLRITLFNQGAERMFGYTADEVQGKPLELLLPEAAREAHGRHMREFAAATVAARRMGERRDVQGRRADGSCFDAEASIAHLEIEGRHVFTAIVRDVSDARRAQRALAVSEAQARAQSRELERAKSEAEAAARAKSLFLANMSHEIRTPLNAVIGMTTLLLDTPMSEDQREFARTIRAGGEQLLEIINDILDYSKADVGKLELEQHPFDLRRCIEESLDLVSPRALEKGLNLACVIEEGTPEAVVGDAVRLRQILVNLLSNGVKFTHQGEVLVLVEGEAGDPGRCRLRITVRDTGIGIAQKHLPLLFQSFTQIDASTTRQYGGTGLGLAITQRLARLMGGQVSVSSTPGEGSSFEVQIELGVAADAPQADYLQRDAPALRGRRLLIVDDNLTNRRILTKFALLWGMMPSTVASALEALDRVRHGEPFDVALLDMSMPGMDGIGLAAEIRRRRSARELPIVLVTSLGQRVASGAASDAALQACLTKPIKAGALYDTLVTVLGEQPAPLPTPAPASKPASGPGLRLLIVEDHPINQRVVLRLVQHLGHTADVVASGTEAVQAAAERPYDVVLMDIQMPGLDGVEAARRIVAARGARAGPRIIAMTANAMPGDRERYVAAGMDGYLAKPVDLQVLAATLSQAGHLAREPEAASNADAALDLARLEHLRALQDDAQPTLVRELIDQFSAEAPAQAQRVAEAFAQGDAGAARAVVHRFLSATQNIGARRLSRLCEELERLARGGQLASAAPLLRDLPGECEGAVRALALVRMRY